MVDLFAPVSLGALTLPNRFVRSATWEGMAEADGSPSAALIELMAALARGGVGLVITGHAFVAAEGRLGVRQLGAHDDHVVPRLACLAEAVQESGAKVALQITHGGLWSGDAPGAELPLGPSPRSTSAGLVGRAMSVSEVKVVPGLFARAARRALRSGFDAVQIHGAHGYLLSSFMSPFFNKRSDDYGGDLERRHRLAVEVIQAVREAVGPNYPVLIKINAAGFLAGGLTEEEALEGAVLLERAGVDAIELSGGTALSGDYRPLRTGVALGAETEAYYETTALKLKQRVRVPVMLVGGIRTLQSAERLVEVGAADLISLSRPLICEPELVGRWQRGDRRPAVCKSCNRCFLRGFAGEPVRCVNRKALADRDSLDARQEGAGGAE